MLSGPFENPMKILNGNLNRILVAVPLKQTYFYIFFCHEFGIDHGYFLYSFIMHYIFPLEGDVGSYFTIRCYK